MTSQPQKKKSYHLLCWVALLFLPVVLKLTGVLDWSWWIVLIPYDFYALLLLYVIGYMGLQTVRNERVMERAFDALMEAKTPEERQEARERWEILRERFEKKEV
jgi:uncharacterized membrane protein